MAEAKAQVQISQLVENFYDIQKIRIESFNRIVAWIKENEEAAKKNIVEQLQEKDAEEVMQLLENKKYSIVARSACKGELKLKEVEDVIWFHNRLQETEKELGKRLDSWSENFQIRKAFLEDVKGIGPIFSSGIIALIGPISRFDNISKLWAYCGLSPTSKRVKGEKLNYNPKLKLMCWKLWNSFVKFDCFGRKIFLEKKKYCEDKHPDWTKGHQHAWAGRKTVKLFLGALWMKWRQLEGLSVTSPYAIGIMEHSADSLISPEKWTQDKKD